MHQYCQHDWPKEHCYEVPTNLPIFARITLKVMGDGLDSQQVTSLGHRMDVYQVQLLLPVSLDGMSNPFVTEWTYTRFRAFTIDVVCN